jgi:predicted nucleic acid-binding protein
VDANVIIKTLVQEHFSEHATELLGRAHSVLVPAHCLAEVFGVLRRKQLAGNIDGHALLLAPRLLERRITTVLLTDLMREAILISTVAAVTIHDAFYVALALQRHVMLVTADEKLIRVLATTPCGSALVHLRDA